jgi:hypothetical protein
MEQNELMDDDQVMGEYFFEGGVLDKIKKVTSRKRTSFDVTAENSEDTRLYQNDARSVRANRRNDTMPLT